MTERQQSRAEVNLAGKYRSYAKRFDNLMHRRELFRLLTLKGHLFDKRIISNLQENCCHKRNLGVIWGRPASSGSSCGASAWGDALATPPSPKYKNMASLESLNFDNLVLRTLPIDKEEGSRIREVRGACFSKVKPTSVKNPETVAFSTPAMALLDLAEGELSREEFAEYMSGCKILPGSETAAHCYCGHQFGNFAGQLGDGAAM